jgi:hypothetical protein
MATKPGKIVTVVVLRGKLVFQLKRFVRNKKGLLVKGIVLRGNP